MPHAPGARVLFVGSECFPLIKTGGLADVMGALPLALSARGLDVKVLVPGFPAVLKAATKKRRVATFKGLAGVTITLSSAKSETGLDLLIVEAGDIFNIDGNPYVDKAGKDLPDNGLRYATFSHTAAMIALGEAGKWVPEVVHAHDWQAALTPLYIELADKSQRPKTVFTIHNLAFQGLFDRSLMTKIGLPARLFSQDQLEFWGKFSFLKAGILYSDAITTVSPTYAREIQTEDGGMGFGGLLKNNGYKLSGIVNGIDTGIWNPETDPAFSTPFSLKKLAGKAGAKKSLQECFGIETNRNALLFGVVSRLTEQKGLDLVAKAIPHIVGNGGQLLVIGTGDRELEAAFKDAAKKHPKNVAAFIGYDENRAHLLQAGCDAMLVPSRFEPCGLTQLCAMRYGTLPIVARVGGLADTVIDANAAALRSGLGTGFQFSPTEFDALVGALNRALEAFGDRKTWARLKRNAMREDVSWAEPAAAYKELYLAASTAQGPVRERL